jgi:hypothetical protein
MPLGAWNKNETLSFVSVGEGSKIIDESGETETISAVRVDDVLGSEKVTYIKMDIEGAEINALIGAKNIICRDKPKLAISVYHKRSDIWEIPMLLLKYNPEYKFFLRVYSFTGNDTVLYAI